MMKRRYVAMISAVLCSAMILSACGNSKKTESIYTGDKTEVPAWQANLDAISPSAYADVEGLDLEPGTYISVIGRAGGTPYWDEVKKGVEQAAEDLNESLGYSGDDKIKVVYNAPDENDNIDEMVNILDEELARYPDVIAVSSIDESASEVQFDLATANGIPIVAFDSGNSYQGIQCICRTDNKEAAKTGVKKLCEAIGDSGEIALLLNDSVSENGKEREAGVKEEIKANHPDVAVVDRYKSWMDGTMVTVDEKQFIVDFVSKHTFSYEKTSTYFKTVNIYRFSKEFSVGKYVPFLEAYCKCFDNSAYYEQILAVLSLLDKAGLKRT